MIDTHVHLLMLKRPVVDTLGRAKAAGLSHVIQVATDIQSSKAGLDLAAEHDMVSATVGIHPGYPDDFSRISELEELIKNRRSEIVALGEIGLDYHYEHDPVAQQNAFRAQLDLAKKYQLPVVIHNRKADEDIAKIASEYPEIPMLCHCFSSAEAFIESMGPERLYLSFTGMVTHQKKGKVIRVLKNWPLNRTMIETDSPYLVPKGYEGQENEPAYVVEVAKRIAELKEISVEIVSEYTDATAAEFFGLDLGAK